MIDVWLKTLSSHEQMRLMLLVLALLYTLSVSFLQLSHTGLQSRQSTKSLYSLAVHQSYKTVLYNSINPSNSILNSSPNESNPQFSAKKSFFTRKIMKRWITGLSLGAIATLWLSSGNGPFTLGILCASLIAQNEYYTMVKSTGVFPAYKTEPWSHLFDNSGLDADAVVF